MLEPNSMEVRRKCYNLYNKLPYSVRSTISNLGKIIPRECIYGKDFSLTLDRIKQTEYWPIYDLDNLCNRKLSEILLHAYNTTRYYRKQIIDKRITERAIIESPEEVLKALGFTNKRLMTDNLDEFLSDRKDTVSNDYVSTGGTSGEPFYFYIDSCRSSREWAFIVDQWSRVGLNKESRRITFRGSRIRGKGWEDDWITRERRFSSFELTDEYLKRIWPLLHEVAPHYIYAYPSTALSLCQFMERSGKTLPVTVNAVLLGSENIYEGQREYIENVSGKRVFMWYGHSEKLVLAGECEYANYYHAYPQYGYVEFINDRGMSAQPGELAEIVGTGFMNTVMPFIRYRTGDYCTYLGDHCPKCGRNYHIFSDVRGRWTQEVLYGHKRNVICMSAINVHSKTLRNVFRFQFFQEAPGKAILRLVPKQGFSESDRKTIENEFNSKFSGNVDVTAIVVDDIPLTKMGKFKFIDQKIQKSYDSK
jgi:phenylacetate-CoA ligase